MKLINELCGQMLCYCLLKCNAAGLKMLIAFIPVFVLRYLAKFDFLLLCIRYYYIGLTRTKINFVV
jgi:hypothetical protein